VIDMNEEKDVPFSAYESVQARAEERFKKMWVTIIILILLLVGSNFGWLIYESQYQDVVTTTQTVSQNTSEGGANSNYFYGGEDGNTGSNDNNN
jgi:hypothetical protein